MESTKRRINHRTPLPSHMKQHQRTPTGIKPIHSQRMLGGMAPRSVGQLVKVGIGRDEKELLGCRFFFRVLLRGRAYATVGEGGVGG